MTQAESMSAQKATPSEVRDIIQELREEVLRDSWNLTRDDHDAIAAKITELEQLIESRYAK